MTIFRKLSAGMLCALMALMQSGCALMFNGPVQRVEFDSNPQGANVVVGEQTGVTPTTLYLQRQRSYAVRMEKEGYETGVAELQKGYSGWFCAGCLLLWGPFELLSLMNGSAYALGPVPVKIDLVPIGTAPY